MLVFFSLFVLIHHFLKFLYSSSTLYITKKPRSFNSCFVCITIVFPCAFNFCVYFSDIFLCQFPPYSFSFYLLLFPWNVYENFMLVLICIYIYIYIFVIFITLFCFCFTVLWMITISCVFFFFLIMMLVFNRLNFYCIINSYKNKEEI